MTEHSPTTDWLETRTVAAMAGVQPDTIRAYVTHGQMPEPEAKIAGGHVWRRATIEQWLAARADSVYVAEAERESP